MHNQKNHLLHLHFGCLHSLPNFCRQHHQRNEHSILTDSTNISTILRSIFAIGSHWRNACPIRPSKNAQKKYLFIIQIRTVDLAIRIELVDPMLLDRVVVRFFGLVRFPVCVSPGLVFSPAWLSPFYHREK